jgi:hypothetical protein
MHLRIAATWPWRNELTSAPPKRNGEAKCRHRARRRPVVHPRNPLPDDM